MRWQQQSRAASTTEEKNEYLQTTITITITIVIIVVIIIVTIESPLRRSGHYWLLLLRGFRSAAVALVSAGEASPAAPFGRGADAGVPR